ncbi:MAG: peptide deformylase [Candidatus Pacebacteria bacterium CG_4_10_14_0_8_um_filter_43_12]|nr:MAG: peptide deformylase [Candidatus Pacebacteria bacterium CG10_big_fil_rev_8_21_14_0_10_44_11]PIY79124.1 MAG: peptide deformylase [Candidatus Pacebacteria bacterium CG_4_10_14_0_8_um_filter_43_12]
MKIVTIPHPTLRKKAKPVEAVDKKLKQFVKELEQTLAGTRQPIGVGLAANQVNDLHRVFATNINQELRLFINPRIVNQSQKIIFGAKAKEEYLEGCLSIPGIYGPVPRYQWVELAYELIESEDLKTKTEKFDDFAARVIQHELDHLNGILFIDYTLKNDLVLYQENKTTNKLEAIDSALFQYV